ncbi:hypothetical protein PIIN_07687 [Serendipita indica DSM 11827]|uniref:Uncharacterized protein n=1 Tax=Serendipita indica (strain DSM 11827) TaxID=1109443 RepID=G4TQY9_SERID|nr:hypothetical protein PIIN_07687 [Serendipita indica DSM 11827]
MVSIRRSDAGPVLLPIPILCVTHIWDASQYHLTGNLFWNSDPPPIPPMLWLPMMHAKWAIQASQKARLFGPQLHHLALASQHCIYHLAKQICSGDKSSNMNLLFSQVTILVGIVNNLDDHIEAANSGPNPSNLQDELDRIFNELSKLKIAGVIKVEASRGAFQKMRHEDSAAIQARREVQRNKVTLTGSQEVSQADSRTGDHDTAQTITDNRDSSSIHPKMVPAQPTISAVLDKSQMRRDKLNEPGPLKSLPRASPKAILELVKDNVTGFSTALKLSLEAREICSRCASDGAKAMEALSSGGCTLDKIRQETERILEDVSKARKKQSQVMESLEVNRKGIREALESLKGRKTEIERETAAQKVLRDQAVKRTFVLYSGMKVEEHSARILICVDAVNKINAVLLMLKDLEDSLGELTSWWGRIYPIFESIEARLEIIIRKEYRSTDIEKLSKSFTDVRKEYQACMDETKAF